MEISFIEDSITQLTNQETSDEDIDNIFTKLINYFRNDRIYISLYMNRIKLKKINFFLLLIEIFIKRFLKDEKYQNNFFQLINFLINNCECKHEIYNYIYQNLSKIYFDNSLFDENIIISYLKLLQNLYQYNTSKLAPTNYFYFLNNCIFEYQFKENEKIDLFDVGLYITLHIKILKTESKVHSLKLLSISSSKENKYSYSLVLNENTINLYDEEENKIIKTKKNEENITFPFNNIIVLSCVINIKEFKFMIQGDKKEYIFTTKTKNEIDKLTFFTNCSGECYSIILATVIQNIAITNYFNDIIKYTQICIDSKYINYILQFYKIQNILCYFIPSTILIDENSFEDVIYSKKMIMNGEKCGIHKFFNNCRNISSIGGFKNLLPIIEMINLNLNKFSNDLINNIIDIIFCIITNLCAGNELNIKDFDGCHFIEIISLFFENIPKEILNLDFMKKIYAFINIFQTKELILKFMNNIILNEKLYFKFDLESQNYIMNELIKNYITIIPIGKLCFLLKYYDEKIKHEFCCEEHCKIFLKNENFSDKIMEYPISNISDNIFKLIQAILIRRDIFSVHNFLYLFRLLCLNISPCISKNIINIFIDFFTRKSESLNQILIAKELITNGKFWDVIMKLFKTSLFDIKISILKLILYIPKGERNENLSIYISQIMEEYLLFNEEFYDDNNELIVSKEYIENYYEQLFNSLFFLLIGKEFTEENISNKDKINNPLIIEPLINLINKINDNKYYLKFSKYLLILFENNSINSSLIFNNVKLIQYHLEIGYKNYNNEENKDLFEINHKLLINILSNAVKDLKNIALPTNILNHALIWSRKGENYENKKKYLLYLFDSYYSYLENESKSNFVHKKNAYLNLITLFSIFLEFSSIYNIKDIESIKDYSCYLKGIIKTNNKWEEFTLLEKMYNFVKKEFDISDIEKLNVNVQTLKQKNINIINTMIYNDRHKNEKIEELKNLNFVQFPNIQLNCVILIFLYLSINSSESIEDKIKWIQELKKFVLFYIIYSCNLYFDIKEEQFYKKVQNSTINILFFSYIMLNELYNTENIDNQIKEKINEFNSETLSLILMIRERIIQSENTNNQKGFIGKLFSKGIRDDLENCGINLFLTKYTNLINIKLEKYENDNYKVFGNILNNDEEPFKIMILMNQTLKNNSNEFFEINMIKKKLNQINSQLTISFGEVKSKRNDNLNIMVSNSLRELVFVYQGLLSIFSNCSSLIINTKKNYYRKIKKEIFSWKGMWSCSDDLYGHKYKYKILNHFSKFLGRPLIYPILDFNTYEPKFKKYDINNLFREKNEAQTINLDIDKIFSIEKEKEEITTNKKINYLYYIINKFQKELCEQYIDFSLNNIDLLTNEILFINYNNSLRIVSPYDSQLKKYENYYKVCLVKEEYHYKGFLFINKNEISFKYFNYNIEDNELIYDNKNGYCYGETFSNSRNDNIIKTCIIPYNEIKIFFRKRYMQRDTGIEIFDLKYKGRYFSFLTKQDREKCLNDIIAHIECNEIILDTNKNIDEFKNIIGYLPGKRSFFGGGKSINDLIKLWNTFKISNFEFLMWLNIYSNRSYFDILQYPIFPWIITKFDEDNIRLEKDLRDFSLPMGMMTLDDKGKERKQSYITHYEQMKLNYDKNINLKVIDKDNKNENNDQNNEIEIPYYYGTQMSNRVYVSHYLTRLFPFTNMAIEIQGDNFDAPDRLFFSIEKAFKMSSSNKGDLRELIPDFFILPEIFLNINNLNLGQLTNGNLVNNVELPEWGKDPFKFIYKQKKILECNIVSLKLNEWINLVFGYQSRGESAIKKCNVFFPDSYEVNIEKLNKENRIIKLQLCDFGLMPKQLCTSEFEIKQKLNEFKLVCDQESIITRYESSTIEKVENKKLYSFKICEEENRILLIDENYDVMVLKLNIDNMEYKSQNKNSLDNQNSKNKRLLDRFNLFKNKASNLIFLNEPNNINFNRDFNFVGKLKVKDNIKYPIVYFRNPNRYNFMTIIQAGFYFPKILISTVDIYSYNTDHNEDKDFVKAYDSLYFANLPYPITALCLLHDEKELKKISEIEENDDFEINLLCGNTKGNIFIVKLPDVAIRKKAEIIKIFCDHNNEIISLYYCSELSIFASTSKDGYINLYTLPKYTLFNSIFVDPNEFSCDEIFLSYSPLPSIIIHSKKNETLLSYSINGTFLKKIEEPGIKSPKIARDSNFNELLIYISSTTNSIRTLTLPYFDLKKDIPMSMDNIECIDMSYDFKYCFIGNKDGNQIIYLKNKL